MGKTVGHQRAVLLATHGQIELALDNPVVDREIDDGPFPVDLDDFHVARFTQPRYAAYGQLAPAQVYSGTSWGGAPDRSVFDGAINRSDHAAFHQQGYGAILVSEDFFANLSTEPGADSNPNYHRAADTTIDLGYARDIVCAINQAVIGLAR